MVHTFIFQSDTTRQATHVRTKQRERTKGGNNNNNSSGGYNNSPQKTAQVKKKLSSYECSMFSSISAQLIDTWSDTHHIDDASLLVDHCDSFSCSST